MTNQEIIAILQKHYDLTLNTTGDKIYVLPHNKWEFTSHPLPTNLDNCILLTGMEYSCFLIGLLQFSDDLTEVVERVTSTEEEI